MEKTSFFTPIQEHIQLVERKMRVDGEGAHPELGLALEHLLSSGGKRVRPAIALLAGRMLGAEVDKLVSLGAAIELLHTATLVHDDFIDGALLRRGIATLNAKWSPAATVLTGDYIFAQAARLAAETESIILMDLFAKTLVTIVSGEITQLFSARSQANRSEYYQRIYAKTASLFEMASIGAAHLSPVEDEVITAMKCFGYDIGMAFQIVDDVLDFTGEQEKVGKPVASDLRQGLITLPAIYYLEAHPENPTLRAVLEGKRVSEGELERLVYDIRNSGAISTALNEASSFVDRALLTLFTQPECAERDSLEELSRYIVHRRL
ncbi:MAG: polyprenyl synthetase family protein [Anaerolineales bacterium]|nr:polyprenyl synthetase family protein [Anaerolineales bacterium]